MTLLRRFLVLIAFAFWQGGFTFYAGVVVPVGRGVDAEAQSVITSRVTYYLNLAGAIALVYFGYDAMLRDPVKFRRWLRVALCCGLALLLVVLVALHRELVREFSRPLHRLYLWTSTLQWLCSLVYLALTLAAWRAQDREGARRIPEVPVLDLRWDRPNNSSQDITQ